MEPAINIQELPRGLGRKVERVCKAMAYLTLGIFLVVTVGAIVFSGLIYLGYALGSDEFQTGFTEAELIDLQSAAEVAIPLLVTLILMGGLFASSYWVAARIGTALKYVEAVAHGETMQPLPPTLARTVKRTCWVMIVFSLIAGVTGSITLLGAPVDARAGGDGAETSMLYAAHQFLSCVMCAVFFWMTAQIGSILNYVGAMAHTGSASAVAGSSPVAVSGGFAPETLVTSTAPTTMGIDTGHRPRSQGRSVERVGTVMSYLSLFLGLLGALLLGAGSLSADAEEGFMWVLVLLMGCSVFVGVVLAVPFWAYARVGTLLNYLEAMACARSGRRMQPEMGAEIRPLPRGPGRAVERVGKILCYLSLILAVVGAAEFSAVAVQTNTGASILETDWLSVAISLMAGILSAAIFWMAARIGTVLDYAKAMANAGTA